MIEGFTRLRGLYAEGELIRLTLTATSDEPLFSTPIALFKAVFSNHFLYMSLLLTSLVEYYTRKLIQGCFRHIGFFIFII